MNSDLWIRNDEAGVYLNAKGTQFDKSDGGLMDIPDGDDVKKKQREADK